jgi:hypothetical protein
MVAVIEGVPQLPPVVVIVMVEGDPTVVVGLPEIVIVLPEIDDVTPAGKPVTFAPVADPPYVYINGVIGLLTHTV